MPTMTMDERRTAAAFDGVAEGNIDTLTELLTPRTTTTTTAAVAVAAAAADGRRCIDRKLRTFRFVTETSTPRMTTTTTMDERRCGALRRRQAAIDGPRRGRLTPGE
jgi:hypothetical protein